MKPHTHLFGLLRRRECLLPTWQGLLLFIVLIAGGILLFMLNVQSYLALSDPVSADVLVVEGWVPDFVMEEAAVEFKRGHYRKVYVTGGPIEHGGSMSEFKSYAELGAAILANMGINKSEIDAVPAPSVLRDRTYASALSLKSYLHKEAVATKSINLMSLGVHSRRSRLLFQQAFDGDLRVGIIAVEDRNYYGQRWWKFSSGVRAIADEFFAYIYALIVFPFVEP
jgi:uncharacterized SAM-binding protein YcdF (DUF218 family)